MNSIEVIEANSERDIADAKKLFQEYAAFLDVDLCFQNFDREMETFPDFYELILLAKSDGVSVGAVGLRALEDRDGEKVCEMKRLFVRQSARGLGAGERLCEAVMEAARARRFALMRLDTLPRLKSAVAIYAALGFAEINPYYKNPMDDVIYMERRL